MDEDIDKNSTLALFDFDGTITNKDSLFDFLKFSVGSTDYYVKLFLLIPVFLKFFIGKISNSQAKEKVFKFFYKDWPIDKFQKVSNNYSLSQINLIVKKSAVEKIEWHKKNNHQIIIVSASIENYLEEWCRQNQLELLGTKLEILENKITGKFITPNCNGEEKVKRIQNKINLSEFNLIYAYGNSKGDLPMLNLADFKYYKNFK